MVVCLVCLRALKAPQDEESGHEFRCFAPIACNTGIQGVQLERLLRLRAVFSYYVRHGRNSFKTGNVGGQELLCM